jgi:uncharacterized protein
MTREQALCLLDENIKNQNLKRHCLAVGMAMKSLSEKLGGDSDTWEILGIIHDSDWEETKDKPEEHTIITLKRLEELGETGPLIHAVKSHNRKFTNLAELEGKMEWALECCDELTGFIVAVALVRPDKKLESVTVDSVLKKFPNREFAKQVEREQISQCEEKLGIPLGEFVEIVLNAMKENAYQLGL